MVQHCWMLPRRRHQWEGSTACCRCSWLFTVVTARLPSFCSVQRQRPGSSTCPPSSLLVLRSTTCCLRLCLLGCPCPTLSGSTCQPPAQASCGPCQPLSPGRQTRPARLCSGCSWPTQRGCAQGCGGCTSPSVAARPPSHLTSFCASWRLLSAAMLDVPVLACPVLLPSQLEDIAPCLSFSVSDLVIGVTATMAEMVVDASCLQDRLQSLLEKRERLGGQMQAQAEAA